MQHSWQNDRPRFGRANRTGTGFGNPPMASFLKMTVLKMTVILLVFLSLSSFSYFTSSAYNFQFLLGSPLFLIYFGH